MTTEILTQATRQMGLLFIEMRKAGRGKVQGRKEAYFRILSLKCQLDVQTEAEQATRYMNMKFRIQRGSISGIQQLEAGAGVLSDQRWSEKPWSWMESSRKWVQVRKSSKIEP